MIPIRGIFPNCCARAESGKAAAAGRLGALEDAADIGADLPERIRKIWPVAHQSTNIGKLALRVDRGNCMARCEMDQLHAPVAKKRVAGNKQGIGFLGHKRSEGRIDLAAGAGVEDLNLQADRASSRQHIF